MKRMFWQFELRVYKTEDLSKNLRTEFVSCEFSSGDDLVGIVVLAFDGSSVNWFCSI